MPATSWQRLIDFLIRRRLPLFYSAVVLTLFAYIPARHLQFDDSLESLFAPSSPYLRDYLASAAWFQGDAFVMVAYADPQLFADAGQERLRGLADQLQAIPGVAPESVESLAGVLSALKIPFLSRRKEQLLDFSRGILLGEDNETTAVVVRLMDEKQSPVPRAETIAAIRRAAQEFSLSAYVVGEPVLLQDMFQYAQVDGRRMGWAASALLIVVILIFLRSVRWVVLPFVIVQMTIAWTMACLVLSHIQLSMVSSILTSLVIIIGVSTVVYMSLYYRKLRERLDRAAALQAMLDVLGMDVFWVCVTTAMGFAAQLSSHIYPVQTFGIMMILGSMLVLVAMAMVLPAGILMGRESTRPQAALAERQLNRSLMSLTDWVQAHPQQLGLLCLAVVLVGIGGLFRLQVETDFSKNFRASSPIVKALDFMETRLGGAGTWEVNFPAPHTLTPEYLDRVRKLASQLRELASGEQKSLTKVVAITDGIDLIPRVRFLVSNEQAQLRILEGMQPQFVPSLYNPEAGRMRIMLRSRERQGTREKEQSIQQVGEIARSEFPEARTTGFLVLLSHLIEGLVADQWSNLLFGVIGLVAVMTLAYRSLWLGVISLIPNLLPILMVIGTMGWIGLPINVATAMISSDTMGLTVHDSIFYLSAFQRAQRSGLDFQAALRETQSDVGRPLVYSNVALVLGFLVLTVSHFIPLVHFGILVSVAILGGLAGNVLLLPILLRLGNRPAKEQGGSQPPPPNPLPPRAG